MFVEQPQLHQVCWQYPFGQMIMQWLLDQDIIHKKSLIPRVNLETEPSASIATRCWIEKRELVEASCYGDTRTLLYSTILYGQTSTSPYITMDSQGGSVSGLVDRERPASLTPQGRGGWRHYSPTHLHFALHNHTTTAGAGEGEEA